jgi:hypothetical protein
MEATISIEHLTQFVQLWALIQNVHLNEDVEDDITWKIPQPRLVRCNSSS